MRGWFNDNYRHSLASRGYSFYNKKMSIVPYISRKSRKGTIFRDITDPIDAKLEEERKERQEELEVQDLQTSSSLDRLEKGQGCEFESWNGKFGVDNKKIRVYKDPIFSSGLKSINVPASIIDSTLKSKEIVFDPGDADLKDIVNRDLQSLMAEFPELSKEEKGDVQSKLVLRDNRLLVRSPSVYSSLRAKSQLDDTSYRNPVSILSGLGGEDSSNALLRKIIRRAKRGDSISDWQRQLYKNEFLRILRNDPDSVSSEALYYAYESYKFRSDEKEKLKAELFKRVREDPGKMGTIVLKNMANKGVFKSVKSKINKELGSRAEEIDVEKSVGGYDYDEEISPKSLPVKSNIEKYNTELQQFKEQGERIPEAKIELMGEVIKKRLQKAREEDERRLVASWSPEGGLKEYGEEVGEED